MCEWIYYMNMWCIYIYIYIYISHFGRNFVFCKIFKILLVGIFFFWIHFQGIYFLASRTQKGAREAKTQPSAGRTQAGPPEPRYENRRMDIYIYIYIYILAHSCCYAATLHSTSSCTSNWVRTHGLARKFGWPWCPRLALAPRTGSGIPDWPWHPGLALAPQIGPGTPRLAVARASQTGKGLFSSDPRSHCANLE